MCECIPKEFCSDVWLPPSSIQVSRCLFDFKVKLKSGLSGRLAGHSDTHLFLQVMYGESLVQLPFSRGADGEILLPSEIIGVAIPEPENNYRQVRQLGTCGHVNYHFSKWLEELGKGMSGSICRGGMGALNSRW